MTSNKIAKDLKVDARSMVFYWTLLIKYVCKMLKLII